MSGLVMRTLRGMRPRIPTLAIPSVNRLTLDREVRRPVHAPAAGLVLDVGAKVAPDCQYVPASRYMRLARNNPLMARVNASETTFPLGFVVYARK